MPFSLRECRPPTTEVIVMSNAWVWLTALVGLPALVVSSPALMLVFVAAGLISLCAAVTTRLLHRPGHLVTRVSR